MIEWTGPFFFLLLILVSCDPRYSVEIYHRELTSGIFKQSHVLLVKKKLPFSIFSLYICSFPPISTLTHDIFIQSHFLIECNTLSHSSEHKLCFMLALCNPVLPNTLSREELLILCTYSHYMTKVLYMVKRHNNFFHLEHACSLLYEWINKQDLFSFLGGKT